jgi:hypothetical protein
MHRAHDLAVETYSELGTVRAEEPSRRNYARRCRYAPFAVGAALIWGVILGVKRKIPEILRGLKTLKSFVKPIVLLCRPRLSGINM